MWWALIAQPHESVSTAQAYELLDRAREAEPPPSRPRSSSVSLRAVDALQRGDFGALTALLSNDFHDLIVERFGDVGRACRALTSAGAQRALLSGSGSCLFALFEHEAQARAVHDALDPAACARTFVAPLVTGEAWR
jgi:4-diphosphocytidyl-2C-methyl-D-erythritol kinase